MRGPEAGPRCASTRLPVTISTPSDRASASSAGGDGPAAPPRHRPPDGMREQAQHQAERGAQRLAEPEHRVGRHPREQRPRLGIAEGEACEHRGREQGGQPEAGKEDRMPRRADDRREERRHQSLPLADETGRTGRRQAAASRPARASIAARSRSRTTLRPGVSAWATGASGLHPLEPVAGEVERPEERRREAQRVDGRAESWTKPGSVSSADRVPPPTSSAAS